MHYVAAVWIRTRTRRSRLPPGPVGLPVLGNVLEVPIKWTWRYFERLSGAYGPLVYLNMGGDHLLVLSNSRDAEELLGRRSLNYSSRPHLIYAGKYQSKDMRIVLLSYGRTFKRLRTAFHQMLQPKVVEAYENIQEIESAKLVYEMLLSPMEASRNCGRYSASLVFHLSYGKRLADDDKDLLSVQAILAGFVQDTYPGSHLVDMFPILDRLPDFLSPWRSEARRKHGAEAAFYQRLALEVKYAMDHGNADMECFAARLWEQRGKLELNVEELAYVAGAAFEAGTDTTTATILWFLMAMVLYPHTLAKAHAELDAVLGADGTVMPTFTHFDSLPYCTALTKEVFRWAPAAPGGFPHRSDEDDEYNGFKIPANTLVVPCIWTMHRNEDEFPDASVFDPDRFLDKSSLTRAESLTEGHYSFGFGRCPGQYLGSKTIWIAVTRLLWAFNISAKRNPKTGLPMTVDPDRCTYGMTTRPLDFPFDLSIRSANHAETIHNAWEVHK
ncbi:cytochrome P450 [Vararia minispora EC-137]|uniref:Cytochrome P450 n=1 Tax=Vararia minispora EC-137 TaxID=1314806 RepID=A0ACB8QRX5_9AGAM|nr:cytochrome P450 [Vararia minispora EC-137]